MVKYLYAIVLFGLLAVGFVVGRSSVKCPPVSQSTTVVEKRVTETTNKKGEKTIITETGIKEDSLIAEKEIRRHLLSVDLVPFSATASRSFEVSLGYEYRLTESLFLGSKYNLDREVLSLTFSILF